MSRETSPYILGDYWLDKRRDGASPDIWQIAQAKGRTVVYRSTRKRELEDAKPIIHAYAESQRAKGRQRAEDAMVAPLLHLYWKEHGQHVLRPAQIASSIRQFLGFLLQDEVGVTATVSDMTPIVFTRFMKWRMGPHEYDVPWLGQDFKHSSDGVRGESVQRNFDDIRAAFNHHEANGRIPYAPKVPEVPGHLRSGPRERVLTDKELGAMIGYARGFDTQLYRFIALMLTTCVRSESASLFDPAQYNPKTGLIDLHPDGRYRTAKRNAFVPAIDPLKPIIADWAKDGAKPVVSHKKAWRTMRSMLGLPKDIVPTTIRHTVATRLRNDPKTPTHLVDEFMGHVDLAATTKRYAKLDPSYLEQIKPGLTRIWNDADQAAKAWTADHLLTINKRGQARSIDKKGAK